MAEPRTRLVDVQLDHDTISRARPDFARDCQAAIADLLRDNTFELVGDDGGPYKLCIGTEEGRLLFDVTGGRQHPVRRVRLPLKPFARVIKDYLELCEVHYDAMRTPGPVAPRGDGHGAARPAQRGRRAAARAAGVAYRHRRRDGAPPVHPDLRPASARVRGAAKALDRHPRTTM